jgi:hypothetical protein
MGEVDYYGMGTGVLLCLSMFACVYFAGRCFRVSAADYERIVEEHGEHGRNFLVRQKLKYGSKISVNNQLYAKLRHERVQAHYIKKDEKGRRRVEED